MGRVPVGYPALPPDRQAADSQPIVEQYAFSDLGRLRCQCFKPKPVGSKPLEIRRVGEEFKYSVARLGQPKLSLQSMSFH